MLDQFAQFQTVAVQTRTEPRRDVQPERDQSAYWLRPEFPGLEFFRAVFHRHSFVRHTHSTFVISVVESGAGRFWYRGRQHLARRDDLVLLNPNEAHDGQPHGEGGYGYRNIYVAPHVLRACAGGGDPVEFGVPVVADPELAHRLAAVHRDIESLRRVSCPPGTRTQLLEVLFAIAARYAGPARVPIVHPDAGRRRIRRAVEFMRESLHEKLSLDDVASHVGLSRFYFVRLFRSIMGVPPHAYLCQLRVDAARHRMLQGQSLAEIAVSVGFYDQSHLSNRFKQTLGFTPAEFLRACRAERH